MAKSITKQIAALWKELAAVEDTSAVSKKINTLQSKKDKLKKELSDLEDEIYVLEDTLDTDNLKDDIKYKLSKLGTHVPRKGAFIGYKKADMKSGAQVLITLSVPASAERVVADDEEEFKCRVSEAKVVSMVLLDGTEVTNKAVKTAYSKHDETFKYTTGKTVKPREDFDPDTSDACCSGIHLFMEKHNAILY